MTLQKNIEKYFKLDIEKKLEVLKIVSKEILEIIEQRHFNKDQTIEFLERNIAIHNEIENYEVSEILTKIKEVIEEDYV